ncbi:deoxynucleoside kinase [Arenicella sp. 4NH20-0111]|uniref:deoxynucleoside kinase n=1 Tax=Arenicella sp. 4NH20-0111 TaxID=3127648 RepID=UPI0031056194
MLKTINLDKKYVVIEGPIGVGKSSLSKKMSDTFGGELFLEKPAENPFLAKFYKDPERYSLHTQLYFLMQRVSQLSELGADAKNVARLLVADFMIEKDPIFARLTLNSEELALYQQVFNSLAIPETRADLVVYLQAPVKVLKSRIKKRNIGFEQRINEDYLGRLSSAYTDYFHNYTAAPLLIVNAADFNPIENDQHFAALMSQIAKIQAGKHFFNPLAA